MAYETAAQGQPKQQSLIADERRVVDRLQEIISRLEKLKVSMHGAGPTEVGKTVDTPDHSMRRLIDRQHQLLAQIEGELTEIEVGL